MQLRTTRLLLRDFEAEDWHAVQEYAADPEAVRYRPFGPCTDEETKAVIHQVTQQVHPSPRRLYDLAIVRAADNRLIGGCDIGLLANQPNEAALGYGLSRTFWGQGYMTEAVRALLAFGFETLGVERISAGVEPDNSASMRVLQKSGLGCTGQAQEWIKGELRVVLRFAISRDEWKTANAL